MFVTLNIPDDRQVAQLIIDMLNWPDSSLLTPCQENPIYATLAEDNPQIQEMVRRYSELDDTYLSSNEIVDVVVKSHEKHGS